MATLIRRITALLLIITALIGCANNTEIQTKSNEEAEMRVEKRTDIEQISEWFPSLTGITSAEWEIEYDDKGKSGLPSPSGFSARGYITINEDSAQQYLADYDWSSSTPHVEFKLISKEQMAESQWLYNWEFEREVRGTFIGRIWFSNNTILFDGGK